MKHLILALTMGLAGSALSQNAADYYKQGEAALKAGELDKAKTAYAAALKLEPNHGNARYRLLSMKNLTADARLKARKAKLNSIILPNVVFEDLTLEESVEALSAIIEKASEGSFVPNFVIDDPSKSVSQNKVNIRLRNIPASVALKYVLSQSKARDSWDAHVISIRPLSVHSASSAAAASAKTEK